MHLIAHRGDQAAAPENTIPAFQSATALNIDFIELDIHFTKDNEVVVCHDARLPSGKHIAHSTIATFKKELPNAPLLNEVLQVCGSRPLMVESKSRGALARSLVVLKKYPATAIASFITDEILSARINMPHAPTFLLQHYHPFGLIKKALAIDASGLGLDKRWLVFVPYFVWKCQKYDLQMYVYTINNRWLARQLSHWFPAIYICTNKPKYLSS